LALLRHPEVGTSCAFETSLAAGAMTYFTTKPRTVTVFAVQEVKPVQTCFVWSDSARSKALSANRARPTSWPGVTRLSLHGCGESSGRAYITMAVTTANEGTLAQSVTRCASCSSHAGVASGATMARARHGPTVVVAATPSRHGDRQPYARSNHDRSELPAPVSPQLR